MANFCENRKNHEKDIASDHNKDHYTVYKAQHDDHQSMQCKVYISKILSLQSIKTYF